ncbi:hypothetical protein QQ054_10405 [Oscillatoria amoena NRMC-F 0135]|nr:hypothetical protein [Oscillatoria amoena NRMC-F 0135]
MRTLSLTLLILFFISFNTTNSFAQSECLQELETDLYFNTFPAPATNCDIEVCFTYTLSCSGQPDVEYRICTTISAAGAPNKLKHYNYVCADDCTFTLTKTEIRRVPTNETIVLTGFSAQQFHNIATRQITGSFTAGRFNYDCNGNPTTYIVSVQNYALNGFSSISGS